MTKLSRPVRRTVAAPRRDLVVSLSLADGEALIEVREKGRRRGSAITVPGLFIVLARRSADQAVAAKKLAKKKKGA